MYPAGNASPARGSLHDSSVGPSASSVSPGAGRDAGREREEGEAMERDDDLDAGESPDTTFDGERRASGGGPVRMRGQRRNVARACEQCRVRKSKCSGEHPKCSLCQRLGRECVYSTVADGRLTDRTAKDRIKMLQDRVESLQHDLNAALDAAKAASTAAASNASAGPSTAAEPHPLMPSAPHEGPYTDAAHDLETPVDEPSDWAPFGTGRLVLSSSGNLHLYPAATFYSPAHLAPDWLKALDALIPHPTHRPGYLAPYLPFPLDPAHHKLLLDLGFARLCSFGFNAWKDKFEAEMEASPMENGIYYSPMTHIALLAVGWRYVQDPSILRVYYPEERIAERGDVFIEKALEMMVSEVKEPQLSTIFGLIIVSKYHTGMSRHPIAAGCYSMALCLAQDLRLHRRCDYQLGELGMHVDSPLDVARRDAYGTALNLSAWYATYNGQDPLPLRDLADQRLPLVRSDLHDPVEREISEIFHYHVGMSDYGLQALHCNHTLRAPMSHRIARVRVLWQRLVAWRERLPQHLQWPPVPGVVLHPSTVTTLGMYATYVIILFRPYLLELGERTDIHPLALRACIDATADIVGQSRYISHVHGITTAPMSWQHILYVAGTMLVLQSSGLPEVPEAERAQARGDLAYVQGALDDMATVWPVAAHTGGSLRELHQAAGRG